MRTTLSRKRIHCIAEDLTQTIRTAFHLSDKQTFLLQGVDTDEGLFFDIDGVSLLVEKFRIKVVLNFNEPVMSSTLAASEADMDSSPLFGNDLTNEIDKNNDEMETNEREVSINSETDIEGGSSHSLATCVKKPWPSIFPIRDDHFSSLLKRKLDEKIPLDKSMRRQLFDAIFEEAIKYKGG